MELGGIIALVLVLLPFNMGAQGVDQSVEKRIDPLATEMTTLDKIVQKLSRFEVSAYIQGQCQCGQEDAALKVGDRNENLDRGFNRIGTRRGRMRFEYSDEIGTGAVQTEVNNKGVSFRNLYIGIKDPWAKCSQLMANVFSRPFNYEVCYSTSSLESPERATIIQYFFPDERDLGAVLTLRTKTTNPLSFLRLGAGLFAGNSIDQEADSRKDFIGRLGVEKAIDDWEKWGAGFSYYHGFVYSPTTGAYEMRDSHFVKRDMRETGAYIKRRYLGLDGQFSFLSSLGKTILRAEGLIGTQPGITGNSRSPNYSTRPENLSGNSLFKRPLLSCFFYSVQDIGASPFFTVLRYDVYDPDTKVSGNEVGMKNGSTSKTDLAQSTVGIGDIYNFNKHIRLQAYCELNFDERSNFVKGYENDRKDNVLTVCLRYKF